MNTNLSILREIIKHDFVFISLVHVIYDVIPFTNTGRQSPTDFIQVSYLKHETLKRN